MFPHAHTHSPAPSAVIAAGTGPGSVVSATVTQVACTNAARPGQPAWVASVTGCPSGSVRESIRAARSP